MRHDGMLVTWKDDRGFGFIAPNAGGDHVYVHAKSFVNRDRRPVESDNVSYELTTRADGRSEAVNVTFEGEPAPGVSIGFVHGLSAIVFLIAIQTMVHMGKLHQSLAWLYWSTSLAAFAAYGLDKGSAKIRGPRIPERTLLMCGLIGGWPGALVAQHVFNHKTAKESFQQRFWIFVALNIILLFFVTSRVFQAYIEAIRS